jgi:hypothetical protein
MRRHEVIDDRGGGKRNPRDPEGMIEEFSDLAEREDAVLETAHDAPGRVDVPQDFPCFLGPPERLEFRPADHALVQVPLDSAPPGPENVAPQVFREDIPRLFAFFIHQIKPLMVSKKQK